MVSITEDYDVYNGKNQMARDTLLLLIIEARRLVMFLTRQIRRLEKATMKLPDQLILIGYWHTTRPDNPWPDPHNFIDYSWDPEDRDFIADYLSRGQVVRAYMGWSPCRICGKNNGNMELTDGYYVWPDGLVHYVIEHGVRLPQFFVDHAAKLIEILEKIHRDEKIWQNLDPIDGLKEKPAVWPTIPSYLADSDQRLVIDG